MDLKQEYRLLEFKKEKKGKGKKSEGRLIESDKSMNQ